MQPPIEPKSEHAFLGMRRFPAGQAIDGDLDLRGALSLQQLGDGLRVAGSLWLGGTKVRPKLLIQYKKGAGLAASSVATHGASANGEASAKSPGQCQLKALPEHLDVGQDFHFHACSRVTSFPRTMRVGGNLFLNGLARLREIPEGVLQGRRLSIKGCPQLSRLPTGLGPLEQLILDGAGVLELPDDLRMAPGAELILQNCARLRALPAAIVSGGSLSRIVIRNCPQLNALPDLAASRQIVIERLRVAKISSGLRGEHVRVSRCSQLTAVTGPIEAAKLAFPDCPVLTRIPTPNGNLISLSLRRCERLPVLPADLCFRPGSQPAKLDVSGCTVLTALPPDLKVESQKSGPALEVSLGGSGLRDAPDYPFKWRVQLHGVWLSPDFFFHLEKAKPEAILLHYKAEVRGALLNRVNIGDLIARTDHEILNEDSDAGGPRKLYRIRLPEPLHLRARTAFRQTGATLLGRALMNLFLLPFRLFRKGRKAAPANQSSTRPGQQPRMLDGRYLHGHSPATKREYLLPVPHKVLTCHEAAAWLGDLGSYEYKLERET